MRLYSLVIFYLLLSSVGFSQYPEEHQDSLNWIHGVEEMTVKVYSGSEYATIPVARMDSQKKDSLWGERRYHLLLDDDVPTYLNEYTRNNQVEIYLSQVYPI